MNHALPLSLILATVLALAACGDDDTSPRTPVDESPGDTQTATSGDGGPTLVPTETLTPGWRTLTPLPTPRSEVAVAEVAGLIYVVGGFEASGTPSQKVEVYNPATDSWSEAPPLPEPRHHTAAAEWNGDLLVMGGSAAGFNDPQSTVLRLDLETGEWSENPPLSVARASHAVAIYAGNPVVVGGVGAEGGLASAEWMDARSEVWRPFVHQMSVARDHLGAAGVHVFLGGDDAQFLVYTTGGRIDLDYSRNVDTSESAFNLNGPWETLSPLPTARSGLAAAGFDGRIYTFGGEGRAGTFDTVEAYDAENDTWETLEPMPTARHGMGAAVVDGVIYVIGGGPTPGLSVTGANEAYQP